MVVTAVASSLAPPAPADPVPPVVQWFGCELSTGRVAEELSASIVPTQAITRQLGAYQSGQLSLVVAGAPKSWESATQPGRTMMVCVADRTPVWAGIVLTRTGGSADTVTLGLVTPEAYLDRRYVGDHSWTQQDQISVVAAGLLGDAMPEGIAMRIDAPASGVLVDATYADADDATVYSRMQDLMGTDGGPEWTIDVEQTGASKYGLVARVRPHIGASSVGAWFTLPGEVAAYALAESYESGKGATDVLARGEGEGDTRYTSSHHTADDLIAAGWPRWEYRYTPSTSITDTATLDSYAEATLAIMQLGASVWTAAASDLRAPRLGRDWGLGDPIGLHIMSSPRHPAGLQAVVRAWGWSWDIAADQVSPILLEGS